MKHCLFLALVATLLFSVTPAPADTTNQVVEQTFTSAKDRPDPFNEIELGVDFTAPGGKTYRVPAFWAGGRTWKVRYASPQAGEHMFVTVCSDASDTGLHGLRENITLTPYTGTNPLYRHGPIRVASDNIHFEHLDGTPFFWLGDTWWMGLTKRLHFPDEFQRLATDRVEKGFTVVQIVAGLYPDMPAFDERGANEVGFPWAKAYERINPEYFDRADARLNHLVESGLSPCIVGAWGYHLPWLGVDKMKRHWRNLVARYGALPVFWCIAGEGAMPYYLATDKPKDAAFQKKGWTEVARYVREIDPWRRPITIHPTDISRRQVEDATVLDFEMLQTGHGDRASIGNTLALVKASREARPTMPTINAEVCYEGILGTCHADVQRFMAWSCLLSATAGHTYGANGIWQLNRREKAFGASPHGGTYGPTPWDEAMNLPGSAQTGYAKKMLAELEWHKFEAHPEWVAVEPAKVDPPTWGSWIWFNEGDPSKDAPAEKRWFRKTFDLPGGVRIASATLWVSADNRFAARVNGIDVGSHREWERPQHYDVTGLLRVAASNEIAIEAANEPAPHPGNPAGLLCSLRVTFRRGAEPVVIGSDATWQAARAPDGEWTAAKVIAPYGEGPWKKFSLGNDGLPAFAAGVVNGPRVVFVPQRVPVRIKALKPDAAYEAAVFNPVTGKWLSRDRVLAGNDGSLLRNPPVDMTDWVLVLRPQP